MAEPPMTNILKLRLLVGYLGEQAQFGWWPTGFFGAYSLQSLAFIAPKTGRLAQYHGVVEAGRVLHDEHLSVSCYHLFRLPEEWEQDLHALMLGEEAAKFANELLVEKTVALRALSEIAQQRRSGSEGPNVVGKIETFNEEDLLPSVAAAYSWAFENDVKTYPYLVR